MQHIIFSNMVKISSTQEPRDFPKTIKLTNTMCNKCQMRKQPRKKFKNKEYSITKPLELIHIYLCRPIRIRGLNYERYFMLLIDDHSRMTWVIFGPGAP